MKLHKLLLRQLNRLNLASDEPPAGLQQWQEFLGRINNTYLEADQERYLNERSINISSRELLDLNEKLENAQHIARLGYWLYDKTTREIILSKELFHLFGLNPDKPVSKFEHFMQMVHEEDKNKLIKAMEKTFSKGTDYEIEIRLQRPEKKYNWYYIVGHPLHEVGQNHRLSGIVMDITRRKQAEEEIAMLNQQLFTTARQVGMADIATSILHNVGNILNSANVSVDILQENVDQSHLIKLIAAIELLKEHHENLINYLIEDSKGQLILEYFITVADVLKTEHAALAREITNLKAYLQHIREIVAMQQGFSNVSGIIEKVFLPEMVDVALQMSGYSSFTKNIHISKEYQITPFITIDKAKLLQILVNLIQNAKDAVMADYKEIKKELNFFIQQGKSASEIILKISDNGIGINPENMIKIFSFGVTHKKDGHGIGLHSCAIAAKEIGGNLEAGSRGIGLGATFILTIPLTYKERDNAHGAAN